MSISTRTKSQLEDEIESLRANLEDAHQLIGTALGYSTLDDGQELGEIEDDDDDESDDDD